MEQLGMELVRAKVAESGEPWQSRFDPAMLAERMRALGFGEAIHIRPESLNDLYLAGRKDGFRMGNSLRLTHAVV